MSATMTRSSKKISKPTTAIVWGDDWSFLTIAQRNKIRQMLGVKPNNIQWQNFRPANLKSTKTTRVLGTKRALTLLTKWEADRLAVRKANRAAKALKNSGGVMPIAPVTTPKTRQTTKMAFCLDRSTSMAGIIGEVKKLFAQNLAATRAGATGDHDIYVSLYYFDTNVERKALNAPVHTLSDDLPGYNYQGSTNIYGCVQQAITEMVSANDDPKTTGYAVLVLTDGEEMEYRLSNDQFRQMLVDKQATDRWTFTFLMPPDKTQAFITRTGVFPGNVKGWSDIKVAAQEQTAGIASFLATRSTGRQSVQTFYVNAPSAKQMDKLPTLVNAKIWTVDKEAVIQPFIESHGQKFAPGHAFYQLTKPETIQSYKNLLAIRIGTKEIKQDVRGLLGLPTVGNIKVKPGNFGDYELYCQSNSTNRKLPRGSKLIYVPV